MNQQEIFQAAQELTGADREAFLDQACQADDALRQRLQQMLAAIAEPSDFLETPAVEQIDLQSMLNHNQAENTHMNQPVATPHSGVDLSFLTPTDTPGLLGTLERFEILSLLGHGGMGIVLKARDPELDRIVAIKVLYEQNIPPVFLATARLRFIREARAMAAFRSDHVIHIHEVQQTAQPPFFVMEYVHGRSLQQKIEADGPLELESLLKIGIGIASGLQDAHESPNKLIHRDIKPANILLENGIERVKIVDFGLAKDSEADLEEMTSHGGMTSQGEILGTVPYMSPEQAQAQAVDPRTDLFSFGATLYCMATGVPPFRGKSLPAVLQKVVAEAPPAIENVRPDLPQRVREIISQLMEKSLEGRTQTAKQVVQSLKAALTRLQEPDRQVDSSMFNQTVIGELSATSAEPDQENSQSTPATDRHPSKRKWYQISRPYLKIAAIIAVIGLVGIGGIVFWSSLSDNDRIDPGEFYVK